MKMFLVNDRWPASTIREVEVKIIQCEKTIWAELPNGKRKLVGSYIFQTLKAAERCQLAMVQKIAKTTYLAKIYQTVDLHKSCVDFVKQRQLH